MSHDVDKMVGDGSSEPLYLTNACCEHAYGDTALLERFGLQYEMNDDGFYPLVKDEWIFLGEEYVDIALNCGVLTGYSSLYKGQKYLMPTVEICFDEEVTREQAMQQAVELKTFLENRIADIGGHTFLAEDDPDRISVKFLIPFEYARKVASDFNDWKAHLETVLLAEKPTAAPII